MELKWTLILGIIFGIVIQIVAMIVWMIAGTGDLVSGVITYISASIILVIIALSLVFTKFYMGKVTPTMKDMFITSIIWIVVIAIIDLVMAFIYNLDLTTYYANYWIYVGDVLLIVFSVIGFKLFTKKAVSTPQQSFSQPEAQTTV